MRKKKETKGKFKVIDLNLLGSYAILLYAGGRSGEACETALDVMKNIKGNYFVETDGTTKGKFESDKLFNKHLSNIRSNLTPCKENNYLNNPFGRRVSNIIWVNSDLIYEEKSILTVFVHEASHWIDWRFYNLGIDDTEIRSRVLGYLFENIYDFTKEILKEEKKKGK